MYFTPIGYLKTKRKNLYKNYIYNKKKLPPFYLNYYPVSIISKQFGFLTGRRIEALRKALVKVISIKTASIVKKALGKFPSVIEDGAKAPRLLEKNIEENKKRKNLRIIFKRNCNLTCFLTKKGTLTRLGKGKGKFTGWVSFIRPGVKLMEYPQINLFLHNKKMFNPNICLEGMKELIQNKNKQFLKGKKNISKLTLARGGSWPTATGKNKQKSFKGPFKNRLPFKCKLHAINLHLDYNVKKKLSFFSERLQPR